MANGENIKNSFKTAFHAVIDANVARRAVRRRQGQLRTTLRHPWSAVVNFHGLGPSWTGKPTITMRLKKAESHPQLYCFNLTPAIDRHRRVSRAKPSGFFFTSTNWDSIGKGSMVLLSHRIKILPKEDILPLSGPPGFSKYMHGMIENMQNKRFAEQFSNRYKVSDEDDIYKTDDIEISKIIANPDFSCQQLSAETATASYLCTIAFENSMPTSLHSETENETEMPMYDHICPTSVAILDCPSAQHLEIIKDSPKWGEYQDTTLQSQLSAIIHLAPDEVFYSDMYQNWIKEFGLVCKHLIVNNKAPYIYSLKDFKHVAKLHMLSPTLFPSLDKYDGFKKDCSLSNISKVDGRVKLKLTSDICDVIKDVWRVQEDDSAELESRWSEIREDYCDVLSDLSRNLSDLKNPDSPGYFPSISILGSGGVHDNILRAQPGFLVRLDKDNSILLDCGEQTLERIHVIFGDKAAQVLSSIKLILLSHKHIDHHAGFHSTLDAIVKAGNGQKVFCLMPKSLYTIYCDILGDNSHFVNACLLVNQMYGALSKDKASDITRSLPIQSIMPVRVDHNVLTFGVILVTNCGKKIVYSSDTLPMSPQLIKYGMEADLLIHDCLYIEEGMEVEAKFRRHGYLNGALATGDAMNAKFTMLTHFAPYYPLLPFENLSEKYCSKVSPALDFLSISISDLHKLPYLISAIEEIYQKKLAVSRTRMRSLYQKRIQRNAMVHQLSSLIDKSK